MRRCSMCGFENLDDATVCVRCGAKMLPKDKTSSLGERRGVTVLVLGVEALSAAENINSEEKYLIADELMHFLVDTVYEHGGTIDKLSGDGVLALFGVPTIHENDPERAVRAALSMLSQLEEFNRHINQKYHTAVHVRIGIHTGWVILGRMNTDLQVEYNIVGSTLALAAKLQMVAERDTILVSADTHKRTKAFFVFKEQSPVTTKKSPDPIPVFQPVDVRVFPARVRGFFGFQSPLVGRTTELSQLHRNFSAMVAQRKPRAVFITGEAGMGKSRIVAEFCASIEHESVNVAEGWCYNYARVKPFALMASLLHNIIRLSDALPPAQQHSAVRVYLQRLGVSVDDILPYVLEVLGVPTSAGEESEVHKLDSAVLQRLIFAALRHLLIAEAERRPLVLILEDLHWVDAVSKKFIEHLLETIHNQPIMLLMVSRHTEDEAILQSLHNAARHHPTQEIRLEPLSLDETRSLVEALMQCDQPEVAQVSLQLAKRAAGNPFFAEEIVRTLIEQETLTRENDVWRLKTTTDDILLDSVPDTLHGLIMARYDRLEPPVQETLRIAAVLGVSFPVEVLYGFNYVDDDALRQYLSELEKRYFLTKDETAEHETYFFSHTLFQEIIYKILLNRDREKLHYRAAQILANMPQLLPEEREEMLAFHYFRSLSPQKALPHLLAAAESAMHRSANEVAIQYYRQALSLLDDEKAPTEKKWLVQLELGQALKFTGQYAEASEILETALQQLLFKSLKMPSQTILPVLVNGLRELADIRAREGVLDEAVSHLQAGLDALGEGQTQRHSALWYLLIERLAWVRFRQGSLDEAFSLASWAMLETDGSRNENPIVLASLFNTLGGIFWQWGNQAKAITYVSLSLDHYKQLGYAWGMATAYANLGILHYSKGQWQEAVEHLERAYTLRQDNGYIPELVLNLYNLGLLRQSMGDHDRAKRDFTEGLEISRRLGDEFGIAWTSVGLAHHALLHGDLPTARRYVEAVLSLKHGATDELVIQANWLLGLAQGIDGDVTEGIHTAERALQLAQKANLTEQEAKVRRALGMLHTHAERYFEAEVFFREAADLFLQVNNTYWQALSLLEMGKMYRQQARQDAAVRRETLFKAREVLQEAQQYFERLGAAYDHRQAETELRAVRDELAALQGKDDASFLVGASNGDAAEHTEAEWHTVTVLWLRLSPPASADEESVFEAMATIVPQIAVIADEFQGKLTRRHDGLMVVFGAPVAYEDDAERAVYAGLQMLDYLNTFCDENDFPFEYGATVSLGKVIAGKMGSRHHTEFVVRGEIVQISQQLAQMVPAGKLWATDSVRHATERVFRFEQISVENTVPIGETVWAFSGFQEEPAPARGVPGIRAKLVGRAEILEKMFSLADQLTQGIGGLIWLEGEPGIGKSRLMQEFVDAAARDDTILWMGKCSPQKSSQAFSVFVDLLGGAFGVTPNDTPETIRGRVARQYEQLPPTVQMTRPYMETLLGIPPVDAGGMRLMALDPQQLRQQIFVAFRRLFQGILRHRPMIVVFDDLHWVDPISAELIQFLMTLVATSPVLFVCAQRRQGGDAPNDRLVKAQSLMPLQTIRFRLERLTHRESEMLIRNLLPQLELPAELHELILSRSAGNPYFIEEFVRMLIEQGYLQRYGGKWNINPDVQVDENALPSSLETLIRSRIDVLPPELKQVMYAAAVVDEPFDVSVLETLVAPNEAGVALSRLESRLLVRRGTDGEWFFNHSLIQTVAYHAILKSQRQSLHRKAAAALLARWGERATDHAETLAHHFSQAGDMEHALPYLVSAGEHAAARFANDESMAYFRQAEESLSALPDVSADLRWRVAIGLGDVYRSLGKYAASIATFERAQLLLPLFEKSDTRAVGLHRRWGETARKQSDYPAAITHFEQVLRLTESATGTAELQLERVRALTGLALVYLVQGKFDPAREIAGTSLAEAQKINALGEMAFAENLLGGLFYRQRNWTMALHHTMRAMVFREQIGYSWGVAGSLSNLGILAVSAGHWNKARSFFERSLALREEMGDVEGVAIVYNNLGTLARDQGELQTSERYFKKSLAISVPFKIGWHIANATVGLAQVLLLQEKFDEAEKALANSLAQAEEIGAEDTKVEIYCAQAELHLAKSEPEAAKRAAEKAIAQAQKVGNRVMESSAWRVIAEVERQNRQFSAAKKVLETADALLASGSDELERARVIFAKGRLALDEGDETLAYQNFRVAKEVFMRLGANLDIERVEQLLRGRLAVA